jgi:hypothetical protein
MRPRATHANDCVASTCHNWHGIHWSYQKLQVRTQGPGANSIDMFGADGEYSHTATHLKQDRSAGLPSVP